ncbi:hypothetical protein [Sinomonas sp. ASV322]|uniref:hypothetical protein n=1 Tax=Sinomonas sp. ASV322 TaxID=3041920 RepID=UPI0027DDD634|nr:hypothetical protein [Sinomonas sp. ASV322]MDQ4504457.1 hypothetical protein [Sinomonas sp. ASV322]
MSAVPAWPIISLRWEGEILVVSDSDAALDPRRVLPIPGEDPFETSRRAAVKACTALGMERARVQGVDGDDVVSLIVDAREGTLTEALAPSAPAPAIDRAHSALEDARGRAEHSRFSRVLVPGLAAASLGARLTGRLGARAAAGTAWARTRKGRRALTAAVVVACAAATAGVVGARQAGWLAPATQSAQAAAPAPAGQLPVYAPAGWGTFASWTVPVSRTNVAPVLSPDGNRVITVSSGRLEALDARTGALVWSTALEGSVSSLRVMAVDGEQKVVVADGSKVRTFGLDGAPGPVFEAGDATARPVVDTGREAFFSLPDQRAMVFTHGGMSLRRIPAGAVAVGVDRGTLLAVEVSTARLWRIGSDAVQFPAPSTIPAPQGAKKLTAVYTAADGSLVTVWDGAAKDRSVVALVPVFPQLGAPTVVKEVASSSAASSTSAVVVDRYAGTVLVNRVFIDTAAHTALEVPGASGKLGAGFWWGAKDQATVRVGTAGDTVNSPSAAPVPLFALPDHRVLVEAGTDQSLYALAPEGEKK